MSRAYCGQCNFLYLRDLIAKLADNIYVLVNYYLARNNLLKFKSHYTALSNLKRMKCQKIYTQRYQI